MLAHCHSYAAAGYPRHCASLLPQAADGVLSSNTGLPYKGSPCSNEPVYTAFSVCTCVCMFVCACVWKPEANLTVCLPTWFFETGSLGDLEFVQRASRPQQWKGLQACASTPSLLILVLGSQLPMLTQQGLYHPGHLLRPRDRPECSA